MLSLDRLRAADTDLTSRPMEERGFPRTLAKLREGVATGVAPGFVASVWRLAEPTVYWTTAAGQRRIVPSSLPMTAETPFDLASISKVYATATSVARLVDRGWLNWNQPVRSILPDFPDSRVQLIHLLSHTAGLPAWFPLFNRIAEKFAPASQPSLVYKASIAERQKYMRELVFGTKLENAPGVKTVYSDLTFLTLGFIIEEVTGRTLNRAVPELVWKPMGIRNSEYRLVTKDPKSGADERFAATEDCPWRGGVLQGQVHDDNCWSMGGYAGHAGAFGTAHDQMVFSARMIAGFLSPKVRNVAWARVQPPIGPVGCDRTAGWDTPSGENPAFSTRFSNRSVGHLGFTGTSLWIDPEKGIAVSLLSNRVHPTRENDKIKAFRPEFHQALAEDLFGF